MRSGVTLVQITTDDELLASAGVEPAKAGEEFRLLAVVKLFELRRKALGQASRLVGLAFWGFSRYCRRSGFPGPI